MNSMAVGSSYSLLMIASSLLSLKGALEKFKVDQFTTFKSAMDVDWSFYERVKKTAFTLTFTFVPIVSLTIGIIKTFFLYDTEYAWHATREAVERPGFFSQEVETLKSVVLYILAGLAFILLCCCNICCKSSEAVNQGEVEFSVV